MATNTSAPHAFALAAPEGRTQEALNILGAEVLLKLGIPDTDGALALFHQTLPCMTGPPLHRHSREDEWFYVLDGEITAVIGDQRIILSAGGSAFVPRGTAHTFQNFHHAPVHLLVMWTQETSSASSSNCRPSTVVCRFPTLFKQRG